MVPANSVCFIYAAMLLHCLVMILEINCNVHQVALNKPPVVKGPVFVGQRLDGWSWGMLFCKGFPPIVINSP